jgi:Flp pilus assembly protein CpaB
MKPKTLILVVAAVACTVGANCMTGKFLGRLTHRRADLGKPLTDVPVVPVLLAREPIPDWELIKDPEKLFELKYYPRDFAPPGAVGSYEAIKHQSLQWPLDPGKPLTRGDLLTGGLLPGGSCDGLQPGQRPAPIRFHPESITGGYLLPGYRVDLSATIGGRDASTRSFLRDVLVLAVGSVEGPPNNQFHVVIVALTPAQIDAVAEMENQGAKLSIRGRAQEKP